MIATEIIGIIIPTLLGSLGLPCLHKPFVENYQNRKANLRTLKYQVEELEELDWFVARTLKLQVEQFHFDNSVDQRCPGGCLPNCCARCSTGKQILKMIREAEDLSRAISRQRREVPAPSSGSYQQSTRLIGIQAAKLVNLIWYSLKKRSIIGVQGVSGVGKTSIVAEIYNRALEEKRKHSSNKARQTNNLEKCFDFVFWVDVTSESNTIQCLQQIIAAKVNVKLPEDTNDTTGRAAALSNTLMKKGSYLLILDDMWKAFSLEDIGIPKPTTENGCKIIVTSRSAAVCTSMKTDKDVQVELLSVYDAWALFVEEAGPHFINISRETQSIAHNVAVECSRLPLAIVTVARTLRDEPDQLCWEETLTSLIESTENESEKVFQHLKFSFYKLRDDRTRTCFLYCALYPKGYRVNTKELMECWMWEGLLGDEEKIENQMKKGQTILKNLKDARLIGVVDQGDGVEQVIMHDLIRDMAGRITETTPCFLIRSGDVQRQSTEQWPQDVERVSLVRNDLKGFLSKPKCPKLHTLLLQYNYSLTSKLCDDFFTEMPLLTVLNLSYTGILSLPDLSKLNNLRALLVSSCGKLKCLPSLQGLEALQVLDISYSGITQLPDGLEELTNLRRLDLSSTKVANFQPWLLCAFKCLEELLMYGCDFFWEEACIKDLQDSRNLVILEVNFKNMYVFNEYIKSHHWYQLKRFKFCVTEIYSGTMGNYGISISRNFHLNGSPVLLPEHTTDLHLTGSKDITQLQIADRLENLKVVDIIDCGNLKVLFKRKVLQQLPNLQQIAIKQCQSMMKVIEDEEIGNESRVVVLPQIQTFTLVDLPKLESIYDGDVVWNSLQTIEVLICRNLKRIPLLPDGLKTIRGEKDWFRSLEWDDPNSQTLLQLFEAATAPEEQVSRQTAPTSSSGETAGLTVSRGKEIVKATGANAGTKTIEASSSSGTAGMEHIKRTGPEAIATSHSSGNTGIASVEASDNGQLEPSKTTGLEPIATSQSNGTTGTGMEP